MSAWTLATRIRARPLRHADSAATLAAGIRSNWWLNTGNMSKDDLAAVNEPGQRLGPVFLQMTPAGHDVAVLWSFTEIAMRDQAVVPLHYQVNTWAARRGYTYAPRTDERTYAFDVKKQ